MNERDFHVHTTFSDGKNTPEEMVCAAISLGMKSIGFSDHSYTDFDTSYCISEENIPFYINKISSLKKKYGGKIEILCGIEQDYYSSAPTDMYDFVIGSVHYIKCENEYIPVDESADSLISAADKYFGGDIYSLAEAYFAEVSDVVKKTHATIIGHFDLISKFNEQHNLFDEKCARYISAWKKAADSLIAENVLFEINTGAISRGYRTTPYPSEEMRSYISERGGKFILSSDSHSKDTLCFEFDNI